MITATIRKISTPVLAASVLTLLLITAIGANSKDLPLLGFLENRLHDLRVAAFARRVEEHPGIAILAYDEETLALSRQRSPLDRGILARALQVVDQAGAVAIGVDILLDQPDDPAKDAALKETLASMQTPLFLAYASSEPDDGKLRHWQEENLHALLADLRDTRTQPGRVALQAEADGVFRRTPALRDNGPLPMAWALGSQVPGTEYRSLEYIDYQRGPDGRGWPFLTLPIHVLSQAEGPVAGMLASVLTGRIVLISATLDRIDQHSTPLEYIDRSKMPGIGIHAHILAQILDHRHPWQPSRLQLWLISFTAVALGLLLGLMQMHLVARIALSLLALVSVWGLAIALQSYPPTSGSMLPLIGVTVAGSLAYLIGNLLARTVVSEERQFIRSALSKYVPEAVASELERHPERLEIGGRRQTLTLLFTDIADFTTLSEQLQPEEISGYLNNYLDGMTDIVHAAGGTLDKYIGDAIVAFWGAPLPCEEAPERAIRCALQLDEFAQDYAQQLRAAGVPFGHTRIGVHTGELLVGNFGSGERFQYTAIGDSMNTAARLEGANKYLGTRILASEATVSDPLALSCRPLGGLRLKGREEPVFVFEPVTHMRSEDIELMISVMSAARDGAVPDSGRLQGLLDRYPEDTALAQLLERIEQTGTIVLTLTGK